MNERTIAKALWGLKQIGLTVVYVTASYLLILFMFVLVIMFFMLFSNYISNEGVIRKKGMPVIQRIYTKNKK